MIISYDALYHSYEAFQNGPFFTILLTAKLSVIIALCFLVTQLLSNDIRSKDLLKQLPLKKDSSYVHKSVYGCLIILSATDLTLLKMLPWEHRFLTDELEGYPGEMLAQTCVYSSLLMSSLQFLACIYGVSKGSKYIGIATTTLGLLFFTSSISLLSSAYNSRKTFTIVRERKRLRAASEKDKIVETMGHRVDVVVSPMRQSGDWADFTTLEGKSSKLSRRQIITKDRASDTSRVYFAWSKSREKPVAIKVFKAEEYSCADVERLKAEFSQQFKFCTLIRGAITDPGLAKLLAKLIDTGGDVVALVTEYIPGGTLEERLQSTGEEPLFMSITDKLEILLAIAETVVNLHKLGLNHGDLQPKHILMGPSGHGPYKISLVDFSKSDIHRERGISRMSSHRSIEVANDEEAELTKAVVLLAAPSQYVAPELFAGSSSIVTTSDPKTIGRQNSVTLTAASRKADVYSMGIIFWEVLAHPTKLPEWTKEKGFKKFDDCHDLLPCDDVHLPEDVHIVITDMMRLCWAERRHRPDMSQIYSTLETALEDFKDVFISHKWGEHKDFVRSLSAALQQIGYRVWFDEKNMGHDMPQSMKNGVMKSKIFLACICRNYQQSDNCMLELRAAKDNNKPIITILLDSGYPLAWPNIDEVEKLCVLSEKLYVDVSTLAASSTGGVPLSELQTEIQKIVMLFKDNQCLPIRFPFPGTAVAGSGASHVEAASASVVTKL